MKILWQLLTSATIFVSGIALMIYSHFKKDKYYHNLKHCKVPEDWETVRDDCWNRASDILLHHGYEAKTKCKEIVIEVGVKMNPKTGQWGRSTIIDGEEFWYAGLASSTKIQIVSTPDKKQYNRSPAILSHEIAETILTANSCTKNIDERNIFLWNIGL